MKTVNSVLLLSFSIIFAILCVFVASTPATETSTIKDQPESDEQAIATQVDSITVTAKRYEAEQIETPSFTSVFDENEIKRLGGKNAYEILKRTGGVNFTSHMPFGMHMGSMSSSIGFRGLKNGELVLLNGSLLRDPSYGYYDIDMIPAAFLDRIEVVKGSGSALYGSQAMTGVINLQLKQPGPREFGGEVSAGSHAAIDTSAYVRNEKLMN